MSQLTPRVRDAKQCDSTATGACEHGAAGHVFTPLQARVTAATPSKWRDGIVTSAWSNGWIGVDLVDDGTNVWLWNHADHSDTILRGEPVAVHALYDTLAVGTERLSVLAAPTD